MKRFLGAGIPNIDLNALRGTFVVIEGADGAGRSTQVAHLQSCLDQRGTPSVLVGIKRSDLVSKQLRRIMQTNLLCPRTLTLFYATDLADQLERRIIPALKAGFVVIADRFVYSLMARALVREVDAIWTERLFGFALQPDTVVFIDTDPHVQASRSFQKSDTLDYWELGQDMAVAHDLYESFIIYQRKLRIVFDRIIKRYNINVIDGNGTPEQTFQKLSAALTPVLGVIR